MVEAILVYAPDKFEPPPKQVTVVTPRVKFKDVLVMAYLVLLVAVMQYSIWLTHVHPKSIAVKYIWTTFFWMVGLPGCFWMISDLVFTFSAYKHRSSPLAAHEYALADDCNYKRRAYVGYAIVVVITLTCAISLYQARIFPSKLVLYGFPVLLGGLLMPTGMGAVLLIKKLSARVCITDDGICVRTIRTSEDRMGISWTHLTGVDVQTSHQSPSGIRRVVVRGGNDKSSQDWITIPGSHPDIERILQDIREHAPGFF